MGMDTRDGIFRELDDPALKPDDERFTTGELVQVKGCWFEIRKIEEHRMILRPVSDMERQLKTLEDVGNRHERRKREAELRKMAKRS